MTEDYRLVYSYEKLVESLMKAYNQENETPAIEWLEYDTIRSLSYMESQGLLTPIIVHEL